MLCNNLEQYCANLCIHHKNNSHANSQCHSHPYRSRSFTLVSEHLHSHGSQNQKHFKYSCRYCRYRLVARSFRIVELFKKFSYLKYFTTKFSKVKLFFLITISISVFSASYSQIPDDLKSVEDAKYINNLASKWSLRIYSASKYDQFLFSGNNFTASFKPDVKLSAGFGASYKNLTFDLATNFYSSNFDSRSRNIALLSSVYSHAHLMEITIQLYHRYTAVIYNSNMEKVRTQFRPDIHTFNLGMNYNYNFNHRRFSFDAASIGTQIQLHSAGTPLAGVYLSYLDIAADSLLLSPSLATTINAGINISEANILTGGITAGYAFTLVLPHHFYVMLSFTPKLGLHSPEIKTDYYRTVPLNITPGFLMRNAIGYSGTKIYSFLLFNADYNYIGIGSGHRIAYDPVKVKLLLGYRFNNLIGKNTTKK